MANRRISRRFSPQKCNPGSQVSPHLCAPTRRQEKELLLPSSAFYRLQGEDHGGQQRQAGGIGFAARERHHLRILHALGHRSAVRGHLAPGAGLFPASEVRHRHPHRACHPPRHARGNVYRPDPHEVREKAEAEVLLTTWVVD